MKEEKELSLEELDDIKAGYPNADKINLLAKKFKPTEKSKDKTMYPDYIKENEIANKAVSLSLVKLYDEKENNNELNLKILGVILDDEFYYANDEILNQLEDYIIEIGKKYAYTCQCGSKRHPFCIL